MYVLLFLVLYPDWTISASRIGYFDSMPACQKFAKVREPQVQAGMKTPIRMVCIKDAR